jgi:chromosome segregation ATPase
MASISPPSPKPQPDKFSDAMDLLRLAMDPKAAVGRLEELREAEAHAKDALAAADAAKNERALADERIAAAQRAEAEIEQQRAELIANQDAHLDRLAEHSGAVLRHASAVDAHTRHVAETDARHAAAEQGIDERIAFWQAEVAEAERLKTEAAADRATAAQELAAAKADREKAARILAAAS